jgi:uncharacterized protein
MASQPIAPSIPNSQAALIGTDCQYPIAGTFVDINSIPLLLQDLQLLILTAPGERLNRPTYGCNLSLNIWENIDQTATQGKLDITDAINNFEPRVTLLDVNSAIYRDDGIVLFTIRFLINATNQPLNLVIPFQPTSQLLGQEI